MNTLRAGVDVGGTNTDAVLVDADGSIRARTKVVTTPDPADGIVEALTQVSEGREVGRVAFGTTHALNAILGRKGLRRVAVIRLGSPGTDSIPPLAGWPGDLVEAVSAGSWIARGGVEIDGRRHPLDEDELSSIAATIGREGRAAAVAIVGMFSPLDPSQERAAASSIGTVTGLPVSLGSDLGGLGVLERENATVLNAALGDLVERLATALEHATSSLDPGASAFLTQNDGTLMTLERARRAPVLLIGAGPSNSLRGASMLSGRDDALVIDVGGTSADVGALVHGFPRESAAGVQVGGVKTNFRMPDLVSIPVGGGTIVQGGGSLGVESVGARLTRDALVFGGDVFTLTDAAVASGRAAMGAPERVARHRGSGDGLADIALAQADGRVTDAIDRMRPAGRTIDLVAVGGGAVVLPDRLPGIGSIERPVDADVANAIGAALAPVAGEADFIAEVAGEERQRQLARAEELAGERAVLAGADRHRLETIWIEEIPLAYVDTAVSRIRAKVAGPPAGGDR